MAQFLLTEEQREDFLFTLDGVKDYIACMHAIKIRQNQWTPVSIPFILAIVK